MDSRLKEAAKLGFRRALGPLDLESVPPMQVTGAGRLADAIRRIGDGEWK
jgi:DNA repair protein RadA/Sms